MAARGRRVRAGLRRAFGRRHCVAVSSGTDALELALRALGTGPATRVIVPTNSFFASAEAVILVGAVPVLVDFDPLYAHLSMERGGARASRSRALRVHAGAPLRPPGGHRCARGVDPRPGPGSSRTPPRRTSPAVEVRGVGGARAGSAASPSIPRRTSAPPGEGGRHHHERRRPGGRECACCATTASGSRTGMELVGCNGRLSRADRGGPADQAPPASRTGRRSAAAGQPASPGARRRRASPPALHRALGRACVAPVRDRARRSRRGGRADAGDGRGDRGCTTRSRSTCSPRTPSLGHRAGSFPEAERSAARVLCLPMFPELSDAQVDRVVEALQAATKEGVGDGARADHRRAGSHRVHIADALVDGGARLIVVDNFSRGRRRTSLRPRRAARARRRGRHPRPGADRPR